jgi:hypothetical protein
VFVKVGENIERENKDREGRRVRVLKSVVLRGSES